MGACSLDQLAKMPDAHDTNQAKEALDEFKESIARRSNVIAFNIDEPDQGEPNERKKADLNFLEDLCKALVTPANTIISVTRIGKKSEENNKPRPLKIVFEDEKSKGHFMGRLKKLGKAEEKYKKVSIVHDLTQNERKKNKELWEVCKEKNNSQASGDSMHKFILKGPPWDRRVAKVKK